MGSGSVIWNENHPALKKYGDDCLAFRNGPAEELLARIGEDRDILVLTDNDPASFELYDMLASSFHSRRIHLIACLPFTYESSRRKREIHAHLNHLEMARSLCLVELDGFLAGTDTGETLGSLQLRIRNDMMVLLEQIISAIRGLDEFTQYRYDPESFSYQPADLSHLENELEEKLTAGRRRDRTSGEEDCRKTEPEEPEAPQETQQETGTDEAEPEENITAGIDPAEETDAGKGTAADTGMKAEETSDRQEPPAKPRRSLFSFLHRKRD